MTRQIPSPARHLDRHVDEGATGRAPEIEAARKCRERTRHDVQAREPAARRPADGDHRVELVDAESNPEHAHAVAADAVGVTARVAVRTFDPRAVRARVRLADPVELGVTVRE